jgi:hypothetical protein
MLDPQGSIGMLSMQGAGPNEGEETSNEEELSDKRRADPRSFQHAEREREYHGVGFGRSVEPVLCAGQ